MTDFVELGRNPLITTDLSAGLHTLAVNEVAAASGGVASHVEFGRNPLFATALMPDGSHALKVIVT